MRGSVLSFILIASHLFAQTPARNSLPVLAVRRIPETACELVEPGTLQFVDDLPLLQLEGVTQALRASSFQGVLGYVEYAPEDLVGDEVESLFYAARNAGFQLHTRTPAQSPPEIRRLPDVLGPSCPSVNAARQLLQASPVPERLYTSGAHGITPPRTLRVFDPEYTDHARKKKLQGEVDLWFILGSDGSISHLLVSRSLDNELDQEAIKTVRRWQIQPAVKDGQPVAFLIQVVVSFRLY